MKDKHTRVTPSAKATSPDSSETQLTDPFLSGCVSSDTECTGLMPTPPVSEAEMEAYEELYPFSPAQVAAGNENDGSCS